MSHRQSNDEEVALQHFNNATQALEQFRGLNDRMEGDDETERQLRELVDHAASTLSPEQRERAGLSE